MDETDITIYLPLLEPVDQNIVFNINVTAGMVWEALEILTLLGWIK